MFSCNFCNIIFGRSCPSLEEFNKAVSQELVKNSPLSIAYGQSLNQYGCSDASTALHVANCIINDALTEEPSLVQYYRGSYEGIYRGSLSYLESGTQSLRFSAIDIYFEHELLDNGSNSLKIIKVEKRRPINTL